MNFGGAFVKSHAPGIECRNFRAIRNSREELSLFFFRNSLFWEESGGKWEFIRLQAVRVVMVTRDARSDEL